MSDKIEKLKEILKNKGINEEGLNSCLVEIEEELNVLRIKTDKKYGLIWEEKEEDICKELTNKYPVLKEIAEREIKTDNTKPTNLLIEGDNLLALNSLLATHKNIVNVCYIDPPYNTGNKDFKYNDRFVDKEDSWKHSQWLSFMDKRLKIAKELLTDDGIIFINIDDNEQAQLKLLCDEIFGSNNFIATIHWRKNRKPHNAGNTMSISHEFIHVYCKKDKIKLIQDYSEMKSDEKGNYSIYPVLQGDKKVRTYTFPKGTVCECANLKKGIVSAKNNKLLDIEILDDVIIENNILMNDIRIKGRYRLTDENGKLSLAIKNNNIFINSNGFPKEKRYRKDTDFKVDNHYWDLEKGKNEDGNELIKDIFGVTNNDIFTYPKPIALLTKILTCINNKNAIVLDFFAGSGTTGHAVLELNNEDGGNRQFILCTNNENNICEEVTYQRLNKVINGYTTPKGKEVEGLGGNLKYYQCELIEKIDNPLINDSMLIKNMTEMIKIKSNCFEVLEETEDYIIAQGINKIVAIAKKRLVKSEILNNLSKKLCYYEHKTKELYSNLDLSIIDKFENIAYYKIPKELLN